MYQARVAATAVCTTGQKATRNRANACSAPRWNAENPSCLATAITPEIAITPPLEPRSSRLCADGIQHDQSSTSRAAYKGFHAAFWRCYQTVAKLSPRPLNRRGAHGLQLRAGDGEVSRFEQLP